MTVVNYTVNTCLLCDELNNKNPLSSQLQLNVNPAQKTIIESKHFVVLKDISPIVRGHYLLLTKEHLTSFSRLPYQWWTELEDVKKKAVSYITLNFSPPFLFEHGSVPGKAKAGACIEHAHIHLIPVRIPVIESLENYANVLVHFDMIKMPEVLTGIDTSYLYYENQDGYGCVVKNPREPVPQQLIRKIVAEKCNIIDWDWKKVI